MSKRYAANDDDDIMTDKINMISKKIKKNNNLIEMHPNTLRAAALIASDAHYHYGDQQLAQISRLDQRIESCQRSIMTYINNIERYETEISALKRQQFMSPSVLERYFFLQSSSQRAQNTLDILRVDELRLQQSFKEFFPELNAHQISSQQDTLMPVFQA